VYVTPKGESTVARSPCEAGPVVERSLASRRRVGRCYLADATLPVYRGEMSQLSLIGTRRLLVLWPSAHCAITAVYYHCHRKFIRRTRTWRLIVFNLCNFPDSLILTTPSSAVRVLAALEPPLHYSGLDKRVDNLYRYISRRDCFQLHL
jgi:hypothetical protein